MPFQYSTEFRLRVCERLLDGDSVAALAQEFSVSIHTLYKWRRQALIDAGRSAGIKSGEVDPLADARRRIKELEAELALVKAASALFAEGGGDPKGGSRLSEV
ncbi:MAG: transposase [Acidimicrobiales bacterium]